MYMYLYYLGPQNFPKTEDTSIFFQYFVMHVITLMVVCVT